MTFRHFSKDISNCSPALLQGVTLRDVDHCADFQVFEDTGVHALFLVTQIQQSCYDLHWIRLQVFQLLR